MFRLAPKGEARFASEGLACKFWQAVKSGAGSIFAYISKPHINLIPVDRQSAVSATFRLSSCLDLSFDKCPRQPNILLWRPDYQRRSQNSQRSCNQGLRGCKADGQHPIRSLRFGPTIRGRRCSYRYRSAHPGTTFYSCIRDISHCGRKHPILRGPISRIVPSIKAPEQMSRTVAPYCRNHATKTTQVQAETNQVLHGVPSEKAKGIFHRGITFWQFQM